MDNTPGIRVFHQKLPFKTLTAGVQEFVSRDGYDPTSVERRIMSLIKLLEDGRFQLHSDYETKTCNIVTISCYRFKLFQGSDCFLGVRLALFWLITSTIKVVVLKI